MTRLIIFDCDGTLVDSQHIIFAAMDEALRRAGGPERTRREILSVVGLSLEEAVQRLVPEVSTARVSAIAEAYRQVFREQRADPAHREPLYPGAREAIEALSSRPEIVLGIATGKSRRGLDGVLARLELDKHFVTLQTADDHPSKPHPSMIAAALAETGAEAHEAVMIGDTSFDMEMARAAGVGAIGVGWGYHPREELIGAGADVVLDDFAELIPHLDARPRAKPSP